MLRRTGGARRLTTLILSGTAVVLLGGCDSLTGPREPEEVSYRIDSEDVSEVEVITSMFFLRIPNSECPETCPPNVELVTADTTTRAVPYEATLRFTARRQFFIETFPRGDQTATLTMRVDIDDRNWYDDFRELTPDGGEDGGQETLRFVYQFSDLTLN